MHLCKTQFGPWKAGHRLHFATHSLYGAAAVAGQDIGGSMCAGAHNRQVACFSMRVPTKITVKNVECGAEIA